MGSKTRRVVHWLLARNCKASPSSLIECTKTVHGVFSTAVDDTHTHNQKKRKFFFPFFLSSSISACARTSCGLNVLPSTHALCGAGSSPCKLDGRYSLSIQPMHRHGPEGRDRQQPVDAATGTRVRQCREGKQWLLLFLKCAKKLRRSNRGRDNSCACSHFLATKRAGRL